MIEVDEDLYGRRRSAKAFVVVSDGQAWSGEVGKAIELARSRGIRVYVVGVGTSAGGVIPDVPPRRYEPATPVEAVTTNSGPSLISSSRYKSWPTHSSSHNARIAKMSWKSSTGYSFSPPPLS